MDKSSNTPSKSATPRREPAPNLVDQVVALRQQGLAPTPSPTSWEFPMSR